MQLFRFSTSSPPKWPNLQTDTTLERLDRFFHTVTQKDTQAQYKHFEQRISRIRQRVQELCTFFSFLHNFATCFQFCFQNRCFATLLDFVHHNSCIRIRKHDSTNKILIGMFQWCVTAWTRSTFHILENRRICASYTQISIWCILYVAFVYSYILTEFQ